ncbi:MAG: CNP1-like family protein [Lysobacterales bacterium]
MLPLMASAQPIRLMGGDDEAEKTELAEREVKLPPLPKEGNLLAFEPSAANANRFFVDAESIAIIDDGTVRYTLVIKTAGGAENISYEAIRCENTELKVYAFGRRDGTWSSARAPVWRKIRYQDVNRQHGVLYAHYFCPDGSQIASVKEAINRFKYGVPYGQPPRSSNR